MLTLCELSFWSARTRLPLLIVAGSTGLQVQWGACVVWGVRWGIGYDRVRGWYRHYQGPQTNAQIKRLARYLDRLHHGETYGLRSQFLAIKKINKREYLLFSFGSLKTDVRYNLHGNRSSLLPLLYYLPHLITFSKPSLFSLINNLVTFPKNLTLWYYMLFPLGKTSSTSYGNEYSGFFSFFCYTIGSCVCFSGRGDIKSC